MRRRSGKVAATAAGAADRRGRGLWRRFCWLLAFAVILLFPAVGLGATDEAAVYRDFQVFAKGWMARLAEISRSNSRSVGHDRRSQAGGEAGYVCYGPEWEIWIKKTGSPRTPYVGFLRYPEKHFFKKASPSDKGAATEEVLQTSFPVTEIFRFSGARWVY